MNKNLAIIAAVILLGGAAVGYYVLSGSGNSAASTSTPGGTMVEEDSMMEDDVMMEAEGDAMMEKDGDAMMAEGVVVDMTGVNYAFSQDTITVKEGDTVTINLTVEEGFHDWMVDEFNAATEQVGEGETTSVTFVADRAGTYEFYCSVGNHRQNGMVGTLIVE